jgi:energy-coupling factor transporter ATP-binding protein EcfA2
MGSLSIQIEMTQLNEHSTMLMVEPHMDLVAKLYDEAVNLKDDNASLKEQIKDLQHLFDGPSGPLSQHEINECSAATSLTSADCQVFQESCY